MVAFPSEIPFASLLLYDSRRDKGGLSQVSRQVILAVKQDKPIRVMRRGAPAYVNAIDSASELLARTVTTSPFLRDYFNASVTLVPAPKSTPLVPNALWPTRRLCEAIAEQGLAAQIVPCLQRIQPVQKSAFAGPGERPEPETHYESVRIRSPKFMAVLAAPSAITLVDDVVTRGSSFIGLYKRLEEAFPDIPIRCFALARTVRSGDLSSIVDPVQGTITFISGRLNRRP